MKLITPYQVSGKAEFWVQHARPNVLKPRRPHLILLSSSLYSIRVPMSLSFNPTFLAVFRIFAIDTFTPSYLLIHTHSLSAEQQQTSSSSVKPELNPVFSPCSHRPFSHNLHPKIRSPLSNFSNFYTTRFPPIPNGDKK